MKATDFLKKTTESTYAIRKLHIHFLFPDESLTAIPSCEPVPAMAASEVKFLEI